jgi:hypothetical protein
MSPALNMFFTRKFTKKYSTPIMSKLERTVISCSPIKPEVKSFTHERNSDFLSITPSDTWPIWYMSVIERMIVSISDHQKLNQRIFCQFMVTFHASVRWLCRREELIF